MARVSRSMALEKLKQMKTNFDSVNTILPLKDFNYLVTPKGTKIGFSYDCEWKYMKKNGVKKLIPVRAIVTRQNEVCVSVVAKKIQGKYPDHEPNFPYAYHYRGYYYLIDGNHRAVKAMLLEQDYMWAYVADARPSFRS